jgi:cytochrome c5
MHKKQRWIFAGTVALATGSLLTGFLGRPSRAAPASTVVTAQASVAVAARVATVTAFLNQHCVACHNEKKHKADLTLHTFTDVPAILKGRKTFLNAMKMVHAGEMPPENKPRPSADELEKFFAAVTGLYADADRTAKPDPGRVTVRRLNRTEYNNTIRDLLGVEMSPAADFPADDIGHGFDNIGDVLTVSPVLMERYLAAAETVSTTAIAIDVPAAPPHRTSGRSLEPTGAKVQESKIRAVPKGTVSTSFHLAVDGDYVLNTSVYGKATDDEPVRATLLVDGKEVETFEVTAKGPKETQQARHPLKLEPGDHKFGIMLSTDRLITAPRPSAGSCRTPTRRRPAPSRPARS